MDLDRSLIKNSQTCFSLRKQIERCNSLSRIVPQGLYPERRV